ncbi:hypothetical protein FHW58_002703 [Duganella sp. 1224]|uniref:hypothetical protein n=1 Tax=Duganella sp. 1224 TaxID=2587052 RepID=UPI0015CE2301|nr:hypothetical protein [Duganella sp. 1224]NYE61496.1 hypothetical protein [Duganella sp. 1224]
MKELDDAEINAVSGAIVKQLLNATAMIFTGLYNAGMNARQVGLDEMYLEALRGGNLGA